MQVVSVFSHLYDKIMLLIYEIKFKVLLSLLQFLFKSDNTYCKKISKFCLEKKFIKILPFILQYKIKKNI